MVGWRGSFHQNMTFLNYSAFIWIRTNCFITNYELLSLVQPLQIKEMSCDLFSGQVNSFFSINAPLGNEYKAYLRSWLFGDLQPGIQLTKSWYLSETLSDENIHFFEQKAISIICEHALSARVINNGGHLVFINKSSLPKKLVKFKKWLQLITNSFRKKVS
ncbi:MAG: hypothetical protein EOM11_10975 [Erysipelotrichia bacterium]|nr:hypothetical protein [Erysipelotrichia bacterium]